MNLTRTLEGDRIKLGPRMIHNLQASSTKCKEVKYVLDQIELDPKRYTILEPQVQSAKRLSICWIKSKSNSEDIQSRASSTKYKETKYVLDQIETEPRGYTTL